MDARRADHVATENRFEAIRKVVYQRTNGQFPGLEARAITQQAILMADCWKVHDGEQYRVHRSEWSWQEAFKFYWNKPNRFEISLWRGGALGALCYGQTSRSNGRVRLDLIEASPVRPHTLGLAALPVLSYASSVFARIVGASEVWIIDPDPALQQYYQSGGYSGRMRYHGGRVGQRRII